MATPPCCRRWSDEGNAFRSNQSRRQHAPLASHLGCDRRLLVRSALNPACRRGSAAGLGGWTFVTRISLATLQATGMGFFGLDGATGALVTTLTLAAVVSWVGIGFQRGTPSRWQIVHNDASGASTLINASSAFALATDAVVTLTIAAAPNGGSVWVRIVDEPSGTVLEESLPATCPRARSFSRRGST